MLPSPPSYKSGTEDLLPVGGGALREAVWCLEVVNSMVVWSCVYYYVYVCGLCAPRHPTEKPFI